MLHAPGFPVDSPKPVGRGGPGAPPLDQKRLTVLLERKAALERTIAAQRAALEESLELQAALSKAIREERDRDRETRPTQPA